MALGAFGAHVLEDHLDAHLLDVYETGVRYGLVHALALLGLAAFREDSRALRVARVAFAVGILLFTGSLVTLALTDTQILGAITPFGGLAFLVGWAALGWSAFRERRGGGP